MEKQLTLPRVLIIEDEPLVAAYQVTLLETAGYVVLGSATNGEGALIVADRNPPDVAIVDVTLPGGLDGLTIGRELQRRYGTAIVFVTGHLVEAVRQKSDIDAVFVGKPFEDQEILRGVEAALARRPRNKCA